MIIWGTENLGPLNCRNLQKYNVYRDFTEKEQKTVIRGQTQQSRKTKVKSDNFVTLLLLFKVVTFCFVPNTI